MTTASNGDTVRVHYTGTLQNGDEFDSSRGGEPLEFTLGEGKLIPGFETAVQGLEPGQSTEASIVSDEAYGPRRDELLVEIPRDQLPDELTLEIGQTLQMQDKEGQPFLVQVDSLGEENVRLDANHPLAGEDLKFEIELVEIV